MPSIFKYVQSPVSYIVLNIMKVGMSLYRLSQSRLTTQIKLFRDMLSLPVGPGNAAEGRSEITPIVIEGITENVFNFILELLVGK